jgi:hypothetical protein
MGFFSGPFHITNWLGCHIQAHFQCFPWEVDPAWWLALLGWHVPWWNGPYRSIVKKGVANTTEEKYKVVGEVLV